jgi:hypothetical protein
MFYFGERALHPEGRSHRCPAERASVLLVLIFEVDGKAVIVLTVEPSQVGHAAWPPRKEYRADPKAHRRFSRRHVSQERGLPATVGRRISA